MKYFFSLALLVFFASCDDGDVIVTTFDFEEQTLQRCDDFDFVFYKVNSEVNEALLLEFSTSEDFLETPGEVMVNISPSGSVVYRRFDGTVPNDFFCNAIPPTTPQVIEEFISTTGELSITTEGEFDDEDGIPNDVEDATGLIDTDADGIVDILDFDDDGDNVPTASEGVTYDTNTDTLTARDSDMDGIPDYLDPDDDGDGVLTIDEDADMDLNPLNDQNDPLAPALRDYLNPNITINVGTMQYRQHTYTFKDISVRIGVTNLEFRNSNGEEVIRDIRTVGFGDYDAPDFDVVETPDFN